MNLIFELIITVIACVIFGMEAQMLWFSVWSVGMLACFAVSVLYLIKCLLKGLFRAGEIFNEPPT